MSELFHGLRAWIAGTILVLTLHVVGDIALHDLVEPAVAHGSVNWLKAFVATALGIIVVRRVLVRFDLWRRAGGRPVDSQGWGATFMVFLAGISTVGVASSIFGLLEGPGELGHGIGPIAGAAYWAVFVTCSLTAFRTYQRQRVVVLPRGAVSSVAFEPRPVMVGFLSRGADRPRAVQVGSSLKQEIEQLRAHKVATRESWFMEPLLAAVDRNLPRLQHLVLVPSAQSVESVGSILTTLQSFAEMKSVEIWVVAKEKITGASFEVLAATHDTFPAAGGGAFGGVDFESIEELNEVFQGLDRHILTERGLTPRDVTVDFTGGQKPSSVVAAVYTFNRDIRAQYVQTGSPWDVKHYDIELAENPPIG